MPAGALAAPAFGVEWGGTEQARAGVSGFAILPGIGEEEFGKLVELLNAKPDEVKQAGGAAGTIVWK